MKTRPAVVVSSAEFHKSRNDVILVPITSTAPRDLDVPIKDWKTAGLLYESTAKPVIMAVIKIAIVKKLGQLSADDLTTVAAMLRRALI